MTHTHDTLMALADNLEDAARDYAQEMATKRELAILLNTRAALSTAIAEALAERDAWKQSNADQIELMNKIADERDAMAAKNQQLLNDCNTWAQECKTQQRLAMKGTPT